MIRDPIQFNVGDVLRFWGKVDVGTFDECWPFVGKTSLAGYGGFHLTTGVEKQRLVKANRFAFLVSHGQQPLEKYVCHSCDNPLCCNPLHLWLGDAKSNMRDMIKKGRERWVIPPPRYGDDHHQRKHPELVIRGEAHYKAKLTEDDVRAIRQMARTMLQREVAAIFGVSASNIRSICARKNWKHVK